jgi:hypothetical protein
VHSTIQGIVFQDVNANGAHDAGEPGLAGHTVFLDLNANMFCLESASRLDR